MRPVGSDLDFQSVARIHNLLAAVNDDEPATFAQLKAAVEGLNWKDDVRVWAPGNVNLAAPGANVDGVAMAAGDRFGAPNQATTTQNGLYIWNGAATPATRSLDATTGPELEGAIVTVTEGTSAGATFRQSAINFVIDVGSPAFANFGTAAPAASEVTAGIAEIATQAEIDAGADDTRILTALKLANWAGRKLKPAATVIGDAAATAFNIDHNLNTRDVLVSVMKNSGNYDEVIADVTRPTVNRVTITFAAAPALNAYRVVVLG